jgi:biopolymer transport protein ExbD
MTWKIRHEGSPRSIEGLIPAQVVEGLQEGLWESTDEVMGPDDSRWIAIENHPQFADVAAELEPPARHEPADETRLDMNPLIDVALVLLIFFIMTASYAALQKVLEMPDFHRDLSGRLQITKEKLDRAIIKVRAVQENGASVIYVEDQRVEPKSLLNELQKFVRASHKTEVAIDAQGVSWGTVVLVQDAAKAAGIDRAYLIERRLPERRPR